MRKGWDREFEVATEALRLAAALCERVRAMDATATRTKVDRSPVTVADYGAQALVCRAIQAAFPEDPIVAEEDPATLEDEVGRALLDRAASHVAAVLGKRGEERPAVGAVRAWIARGAREPRDPARDRFWTLDPIDGTKGFLRGDQYAIALALMEGGIVRLGLLACPALTADRDAATPRAGGRSAGVLIAAVEGAGARLRGLAEEPHAPPSRELRVADVGAPGAWRFVESVEGAHGHPELQRRIAHSAGIEAEPLRLDSQVKYAAVADGRAALYLRLPSPSTPDYREKIWDHAAGTRIVLEAGGRVTDAAGGPLDFTRGQRLERNRGIVAGAPEAHRAAVAALRAHVAAQSPASARG